MCNIQGCDSQPVAKGLCGKHYMRQLRTGDPNTAPRKSGPKSDPVRRQQRVTMNDCNWSDRTFARYRKAITILQQQCGIASRDLDKVLHEASRADGSVNVSFLLNVAH